MESERENLVFSLKIFCFFSAPLKQKEETAKHFLSGTKKHEESSKKKTTKADRVHNNKSSRTRGSARAPKFTRTKRNERKSEVLPADTKKNSNRTITAADRLLLFAAVATCA